jgi:hypothetical protein
MAKKSEATMTVGVRKGASRVVLIDVSAVGSAASELVKGTAPVYTWSVNFVQRDGKLQCASHR